MRRSSRQQLQQQQQISSTGQDLDSSSSSSHPQLPPILSYPPSNSSVTTGGYPQQQQQGSYPLHRADELGRHESYLQQQQYEQQLASNQPQHLQQFEHQQHQPLQHQQQYAEQQQQHQRQDSISSRRAAAKREPATDMLGTSASGSRSSIDDSMPSASDFVKKLYKMLEDQSIANVVSWGPQGDCFVVKDMNEFTKTILPRLFKHSNFASFVRQLNKYDFHKVKNGDDNQFGEHSWTFRHQNFHADRREDLENIKRKVPAGRKPTASLPPVSTSQPHTSQPLSSSSSSHHQRGEYPYRRGSQSRHHSPSPYGGPPSPGSYEYSHGGYDHDSGYDRHRHGGHHHHSSSYDHLQQQLSALQSQLTGLSSSTSALSAQLRALAESQQSLGRDVENVRGEVADVRRRESEIRDEMRRSMLAVNGTSAGGASLALSSELSQLSRQTTKLTQDSDQMGRRVGDLERGYKNILGEVGVLQRGLLGAANTASTLSLGGAGANGAGSAAQSLEEMLKSETGVGLDSMTGVEASTPGSNYWGVRGLVGGWLEGSNNGQSSQGRGEGSSSSPNLGGSSSSANATSDPSSDNASGRQQGLDSSNASPSLSGGQPSSSSSPANHTSPPTAAANASTSSSSSGRPAFNIPTDDSRNPFLPMQLPPDAAKASLVQLNELSRRADQVGFSLDFGEGFQGNGAPPRNADGSSSWQQQQQSQSSSSQSTQQQQQGQQQRPPPTSKIWEAANNAGLFGNGVGFSYTGTSNEDSPSGWPDTAPFNKGGQGSSSASSAPSGTSPTGSGNDAVLSHEGLQVYTVGHLVPRDQLQLSANQWTFGDPTQQQQQQQQQQQYSGGPYRQPSDAQFEEFQQGSSSSSSRPSLNNSTSAPPAGPSPSIAEVTSPTSSTSSSSTSTAMVASSSNTTRPKLRVRRSTFVPGWAVPPRVLLVDDDAVSRKLGSKFLQVFGCTIDVAVDGVGAVNKMNLEKYDLVLMDIVMPKLDGISATSLIRKFDPMTPIISMTSNSKPSEIMTYYSSGMNDILPKPFTKEGMLDMLEKHLTHLRIIQQMSRGVPPSVGIPPLSDAGFQQALQASATNLLTGPSPSGGPTSVASSNNSNNENSNTSNTTLTLNNYEDDGRINPLAGMGLSDDQYNSMLQNMVNGDSFFNMGSTGASGSGSGMTLNLGFGMKRGYEESSSGNGEDGREGKRSRFEVIE